MSTPEQPPESTTAKSKGPKTPLYIRMYFQEAYIEFVRFIGYGGKTLDEAREFARLLATRHGKPKAMEAGEALVVIDQTSTPPMVRLTDEVRKLAFQMLGPQPKPGTAAPKHAPALASGAPNKRRAQTAPDGDGRPVKQPRHFVLGKFETWMNDCGLAFVAIDDVKKTTPAVQQFISGLDFIVLRGDAKLLVTVRPYLQAKHVNAMRELQKLFGPEYQPVRFWPADGPDGWRWQEHPVDVAADASS